MEPPAPPPLPLHPVRHHSVCPCCFAHDARQLGSDLPEHCSFSWARWACDVRRSLMHTQACCDHTCSCWVGPGGSVSFGSGRHSSQPQVLLDCMSRDHVGCHTPACCCEPFFGHDSSQVAQISRLSNQTSSCKLGKILKVVQRPITPRPRLHRRNQQQCAAAPSDKVAVLFLGRRAR